MRLRNSLTVDFGDMITLLYKNEITRILIGDRKNKIVEKRRERRDIEFTGTLDIIEEIVSSLDKNKDVTITVYQPPYILELGVVYEKHLI